MKNEEIIIVAILTFMVIICAMLLVGIKASNQTKQAKQDELIINGALVDLSLDRNDFEAVELKEFDGTNVFILRLDERLFLGAYNVGEDGIYVDVVKEI